MTADGKLTAPAIAVLAAVLAAAMLVFSQTLASVFGNATSGAATAAAGALVAALAGIPAAVAAIIRGGPPTDPKLEPAMLGAAPFLLTAAGLVVLGPARLGFEFWIWRLDVAALVFLAVGLMILAVGTRAVLRHGALAVILVAIPPVLLPLARAAAAPAADSIRWAAAKLSQALPLGVTTDSAGRFLNVEGEAVSIGEVCSGLDAAGLITGFVLVLFVLGAGAGWRKGVVALTAVGLLWLANLVRATVLLGAHGAGADQLFHVLHAVTGLVAIGVVVVVTVLVARQLGIKFEAAGIRGVRVAYTRTHVVVGGAVAASAVVLCGLGMGASAAEGLGGVAVGEPVMLALAEEGSDAEPHLVLDVPGWSVRHDATYPWFGALFGDESDAGSFTLMRDGERPAWVQVITSRSLRRLDRYGPVECFVAHGWTPVRVRRVELPGGAGMLAQHRRSGGDRVSALSWTQPAILPDGSDGFARYLVMADAQPGDDQDVEVADGLLDRTAFGFMNLLSVTAERDPGDTAFGPSNRYVLEIARSMLQAGRA